MKRVYPLWALVVALFLGQAIGVAQTVHMAPGTIICEEPTDAE